MGRLLSAFQTRAELLLAGDVDAVVDACVVPMWTKFRGLYWFIGNRQEMWETLSRQHLSQKARGVRSIRGALEEFTDLPNGRHRISILWTEAGTVDQCRSFAVDYVCRGADGQAGATDLGILGMTVREVVPPRAPPPRAFPPPCEDW